MGSGSNDFLNYQMENFAFLRRYIIIYRISLLAFFIKMVVFQDGSKLLGHYPIDQTTFVFARPDKEGRTAIFGMLTIRDGKSVALEVCAESNESKQEWITALRSANIGNIKSTDATKPQNEKAQQSDCYGSEKDCNCTIM